MRLRRSARVLLFDASGDVLLIRFRAETGGRTVRFWVTPGGEIEAGVTADEVRLMQEARWWSAEELATTDEVIYPERLAELADRIWSVAKPSGSNPLAAEG